MTTNRVTLKKLGRIGRWGNQLFQYMFLRGYAIRYGLDYQCPEWAGQYLFGLNDPPITDKLPVYEEYRPWDIHIGASMAPSGGECHGHDLGGGYFQWHTSYYAPYRELYKEWFTCRGSMANRLRPGEEQFLQHETRIGIHLRRGDTGRKIFYLTPPSWYLRWLGENWHRFKDPVLYVASEDPLLVDRFAGYNPITFPLTTDRIPHYNYLPFDMKHPTPAAMDFYPDWHFLTLCNVLLLGNSTYGFTAAMFASDLLEAYRSRLSTQTFDRIYPWDCTPMTFEHLDDHRGIPGTQFDENPGYWQPGWKPKHPSVPE